MEYADCGPSDKPCGSSLVPQSVTQTIDDSCGGGIHVIYDCFGMYQTHGERCGASKMANCPVNPCSTLKDGESCISSVDSTCGGSERYSGADNFLPGGPADCRWEGYDCDDGKTTFTTITCKAVTGPAYYKRTCN